MIHMYRVPDPLPAHVVASLAARVLRWVPLLWRVAAALFLCSCAHAPACRTGCGLRAEGMDCATVRRAEARAVLYLGESVDGWTPRAVCEAIDKWTVRIHRRVPADTWCSGEAWKEGTICVRGYTDDATRTIWVPNGDLPDNAFTHEVVHVVDLAVTGHDGHCGWLPRGAVQGIYLATGNAVPPDEESDCPSKDAGE